MIGQDIKRYFLYLSPFEMCEFRSTFLLLSDTIVLVSETPRCHGTWSLSAVGLSACRSVPGATARRATAPPRAGRYGQYQCHLLSTKANTEASKAAAGRVKGHASKSLASSPSTAKLNAAGTLLAPCCRIGGRAFFASMQQCCRRHHTGKTKLGAEVPSQAPHETMKVDRRCRSAVDHTAITEEDAAVSCVATYMV